MKHIPIAEKVLINKLYHTECPYYKTEIQKTLIQTGRGGTCLHASSQEAEAGKS